MVSHGDNSEHDFDDWASAHGSLLPWSEDQTTAAYQVAQLSHLQQYARANARTPGAVAASDLHEPAWLDTNSEWDPAPIILEETAIPAAHAAHTVPAREDFAQFEPFAAPPAYPSVDPSAREREEREQREQHEEREEREDHEENPFASPHPALKAWLFTTLAAAGLASGVLFGRMLLRTSMLEAEPLPQSVLTPMPMVEPAAPAPDAIRAPAPEARTEAPPVTAAEPAAARVQPQKRAGHTRASHTGGEWNLEPPERMSSEPGPVSAASSRQQVSGPHGADPAEAAVSQPSAAEAAAPATLRINSRPWSQVFVDGQLIGTTPQLGVSVSAGKHTIRLVNPAFGMTKTFPVNVGPGESVTRIEILQE